MEEMEEMEEIPDTIHVPGYILGDN